MSKLQERYQDLITATNKAVNNKMEQYKKDKQTADAFVAAQEAERQLSIRNRVAQEEDLKAQRPVKSSTDATAPRQKQTLEKTPKVKAPVYQLDFSVNPNSEFGKLLQIINQTIENKGHAAVVTQSLKALGPDILDQAKKQAKEDAAANNQIAQTNASAAGQNKDNQPQLQPKLSAPAQGKMNKEVNKANALKLQKSGHKKNQKESENQLLATICHLADIKKGSESHYFFKRIFPTFAPILEHHAKKAGYTPEE